EWAVDRIAEELPNSLSSHRFIAEARRRESRASGSIMKAETKQAVVRWLCLLAGGMDGASGLLLIFAPALALRLMGVPAIGGEALIFIRFIGAFVFGVGMLYGVAWLAQLLPGR